MSLGGHTCRDLRRPGSSAVVARTARLTTAPGRARRHAGRARGRRGFPVSLEQFLACLRTAWHAASGAVADRPGVARAVASAPPGPLSRCTAPDAAAAAADLARRDRAYLVFGETNLAARW